MHARTHALTNARTDTGAAVARPHKTKSTGAFGSLSSPLSRSGTGAATMTACRVSLSLERFCSCQRPAAQEAAAGADASAHADGTEVPPPGACAGFTMEHHQATVYHAHHVLANVKCRLVFPLRHKRFQGSKSLPRNRTVPLVLYVHDNFKLPFSYFGTK